MKVEYSMWIPSVLEVAKEAAFAIMEIYNAKKFKVKTKLDDSPVTEADFESHRIIVAGLQKIDHQIPIVSEEGVEIPYATRSQWPYHWLVDPLDGTKEFIRGTGEFTINIALIENNYPVLGLVLAPALKKCYWAVQGGMGAYLQESNHDPQIIHTKSKFEFPIKIALSHHHAREEAQLTPLLKKFKSVEMVYCGSALKICLVAEGKVDLYPRFGPTGEWDTAAGQCILEAAGGKLIDFKGNVFNYNLRRTHENPGFLAMGPLELLPWVVDK